MSSENNLQCDNINILCHHKRFAINARRNKTTDKTRVDKSRKRSRCLMQKSLKTSWSEIFVGLVLEGVKTI